MKKLFAFTVGFLLIAIALWLPFVLLPASVREDVTMALGSRQTSWVGAVLKPQSAGTLSGKVLLCSSEDACQPAPERQVRIFDARQEHPRVATTGSDGSFRELFGQGAYWVDVPLASGERTEDAPGYVFVQPQGTSTITVRIRR